METIKYTSDCGAEMEIVVKDGDTFKFRAVAVINRLNCYANENNYKYNAIKDVIEWFEEKYLDEAPKRYTEKDVRKAFYDSFSINDDGLKSILDAYGEWEDIGYKIEVGNDSLRDKIALQIFNAKITRNSLADLGETYSSVWAWSIEMADMVIMENE